jgi:protein-L-isoaspartate(D-aspartate) O-methyltransferase
MVALQLIPRGICCQSVLAAMARVPREQFVLHEDVLLSYRDGPLMIGQGQTISQPYIVAYMTQTLGLRPGESVLEIGTGSGYQTAVLAELTSKVFTIERIPELANRAKAVLSKLGYEGITFFQGDGLRPPLPLQSVDAILLTAAPPVLPTALLAFLREGGRMLLPLGRRFQTLTLVHRRGEDWQTEPLLPVRFVPMLGDIEGAGVY